jgi:PAS domain S-box-containing protein
MNAERLDQLDRVLRAIRNVNQLIVREKDPCRLIARVCESLVETLGCDGAWIGIAGPDGAPAAWAEAGWGAAFAPVARRLERGEWPPCWTQCSAADTTVVLDPERACVPCPLSPGGRAGGTAAAAALRHGGRVCGMLGVHFPGAAVVDAEEVELIDELVGDIAFALHSRATEAERQKAESQSAAALAALGEHNRLLEQSNGLLMELAALPMTEDVRQRVARGLRQVTGAAAAAFSEYDAERRVLITRSLDIEAGLGQRVVSLLGRRLEGIESPVSDQTYQQICETIVGRRRTLTEVTFGAIPRALGAVAQSVAGVERFLGLAHVIDGRLFGCSVLAMRSGEPDPPEQWLRSVAHAIAVALRRRLAELKLVQSEGRFRTLFEASPSGFLLVDCEGTVLEANRCFLRLVEAEPHEVVGKNAFALARAAGLAVEPLRADLQRRFRGEAGSNELTFRHRSGELRTVALRSVPLFAAGLPSQMVFAFDDITERKRVERSLCFKNMVFERSIAAQSIADKNRVITEVNEAFLAAWGYQRKEDIIGTPLSRLLADPEAFAPALAALDATGAWAGDFRAQRPDGSTFLAQGHATTLVDEQGQIIGYQWACFDVTRERRAEDERRQLEASLAQSDRLASMGMLAAGVAHEINNPLAYVLYNLQSLSEDLPALAQQLDGVHRALRSGMGEMDLRALCGDGAEALRSAAWADVLERCRDALTGTRRIQEIARGLGTFSRVESDAVAPVYLGQAIESALGIAHNEIKYRARIEKDLRAGLPVLGSEGRLSQVFLNLLVNAAHAIEEGSVETNRIGVRTWEEGATVVAEVRDTGSGIPAEHLARIFEPFYTTKPVGVGSGLGLSIVRSIVSGFGGSIEVESEVGKGTRFVIRLPAARTRPAHPTRSSGLYPAVDGARGRVLVIDDDRGIRSALRRMLRKHEVVEADSGERALSLLEKDSRFDVILCDMMMPAMSGAQLHRRLVDCCPEAAKRVVFVTGGAFTPAAREYLGTVDNARLEKPFDPTSLRDMVSEWVRASQADRANA